MNADGPLSPDQKAALSRATERRHRLLRRARLATTSVWTVGGFGALTLLWGLAAGGGGIIVGLALLAIAWNERRGRDRLRDLDPAGARVLGWNQLILGGVIVAYCGAAIVRAHTAPDPSVQELETMVGLDPGLAADLTTLAYGIVAAVVALTQLLLARYHFRGAPLVAAFRRETPDWILDLLRRSDPASARTDATASA